MGRRGRPPHPDVLTPREFEVLELLRQGLSNPEIADRLGISRDGAKDHVSEILTKLGLSTREGGWGWVSSGRPLPGWRCWRFCCCATAVVTTSLLVVRTSHRGTSWRTSA